MTLHPTRRDTWSNCFLFLRISEHCRPRYKQVSPWWTKWNGVRISSPIQCDFCYFTSILLYLLSYPSQLKLQSDIATFQSSAKKSRKQLCTFVDVVESPYLTEWRILNFNPQTRMETEGLPVPVRISSYFLF